MITTDERALTRLGLYIDTIEGREYVIDRASGHLVARVVRVSHPSALAFVEPLTCGVCGDVLPDDAKFCIACGAQVAAMGRTERL